MEEQLIRRNTDQVEKKHLAKPETIAMENALGIPFPGKNRFFVTKKHSQFFPSSENDLLHILGSMQLLDIGPHYTLMWTCFGCDASVQKSVGKDIIREIHTYHVKSSREIIKTYRGKILNANGDSTVSAFIQSLDGMVAAKSIQKEICLFNETIRSMKGGICVKSGIHKIDTTRNGRYSLEHMILTVKELVNEAGPQEICVSEEIAQENRNMEFIRNSFYLYPIQKILLEHTRNTHAFRRMVLHDSL